MKKSNIILIVILGLFLTSFTVKIIMRGNSHNRKLELTEDNYTKKLLDTIDGVLVSGSIELTVMYADNSELWIQKTNPDLESFETKIIDGQLDLKQSNVNSESNIQVTLKANNLGNIKVANKAQVNINEIELDSIQITNTNSRVYFNNCKIATVNLESTKKSHNNFNSNTIEYLQFSVSENSNLSIYNGETGVVNGELIDHSVMNTRTQINRLNIKADSTSRIWQRKLQGVD